MVRTATVFIWSALVVLSTASAQPDVADGHSPTGDGLYAHVVFHSEIGDTASDVRVAWRFWSSAGATDNYRWLKHTLIPLEIEGNYARGEAWVAYKSDEEFDRDVTDIDIREIRVYRGRASIRVEIEDVLVGYCGLNALYNEQAVPLAETPPLVSPLPPSSASNVIDRAYSGVNASGHRTYVSVRLYGAFESLPIAYDAFREFEENISIEDQILESSPTSVAVDPTFPRWGGHVPGFENTFYYGDTPEQGHQVVLPTDFPNFNRYDSNQVKTAIISCYRDLGGPTLESGLLVDLTGPLVGGGGAFPDNIVIALIDGVEAARNHPDFSETFNSVRFIGSVVATIMFTLATYRIAMWGFGIPYANVPGE